MYHSTISCTINVAWGSNSGSHAHKVSTCIIHFIILEALILVPNEDSFDDSVYLLGAFKKTVLQPRKRLGPLLNIFRALWQAHTEKIWSRIVIV